MPSSLGGQMQHKKLLLELLECEFEDDAIVVLHKHGLFEEKNGKRWIPLGKMPNNQSVVHAQQSSAAAALVEKFTNGLDAILLRRCKADGIDPRSAAAPGNMSKAVQRWFGDLGEKSTSEIRQVAKRTWYSMRPAQRRARVSRFTTPARANSPRASLQRSAR